MDIKQFYSLFKIYKPIQHDWELYWLVNKVERIKPNIILEIGVNTGATLGFWNYILSENSKNKNIGNSRLIGIDIKNNMKWDTRKSKNNIDFLIADSTKNRTLEIVKNILQNKKIDFLYIDGNHTEKFITLDYQNYSKFVRRGGLIAFHDINNDRYPGAKQFWKKVDGKVKGRKQYCFCNQGTGLIIK